MQRDARQQHSPGSLAPAAHDGAPPMPAGAWASPVRTPQLLRSAGAWAGQASVRDAHDGGAAGRRREPRVVVVDEFCARLWSDRAALALLPVVDLSTYGLRLGASDRMLAGCVSVELVGRMWHFLGRARVVGCTERMVRLSVVRWDGRARECIEEFVRTHTLAHAL